MLYRLVAILILLVLPACRQQAEAQWTRPELAVIDSLSDDNRIPINQPRLVVSDSGIFVFFNYAITNFLLDPTDIFVVKKLAGGWTLPQNVTNTPTPSFAPAVAGDAHGGLHLVWMEQRWVNGRSSGRYATDIFYSSARNGIWSPPERLFCLDSNGNRADKLQTITQLLVDEKNALNFTFHAKVFRLPTLPSPLDSQLVFMKRENNEWSKPKKYVNFGFGPSLAVGKNGKMYSIYLSSLRPGPDVNSVFLAVSRDEGKTWSSPRLVSKSDDYAANEPKIYVTGSTETTTRLHAVWLKDYDPDDGGLGAPNGVLYSFSDNDGQTWSRPDTLSRGIVSDFMLNLRGVTDKNDNIHIIYADASNFPASTGKLFYQTCRNGRWSSPMQLPSGIGLSLNADIAVGNDGKVHIVWVDIEKPTRGIYYITSDIATSSASESSVAKPTAFELFQNYPNPFNPTTVISYQLPVAGQVSLKIYDVLGREVATLVNQRQEPGRYNATFNAAGLSSGAYFYRLSVRPSSAQAGSFVSTKKMMLVR